MAHRAKAYWDNGMTDTANPQLSRRGQALPQTTKMMIYGYPR